MTLFLFQVRKMRLELTRDCSHKILSLARLPIPTLPHRAFCNAPNDINKSRNGCQGIFKMDPGDCPGGPKTGGPGVQNAGAKSRRRAQRPGGPKLGSERKYRKRLI